MFRIESYITSIILSYVEKYVKNLRRQDAQVYNINHNKLLILIITVNILRMITLMVNIIFRYHYGTEKVYFKTWS